MQIIYVHLKKNVRKFMKKTDLTSLAVILPGAMIAIDFRTSSHDFSVLSNQTGDSGIKGRYNKFTALLEIKQPYEKLLKVKV